ncbi:Ankyrin repeat domain-containing protein 50 [Cladobotryum mycophilum]|uniref:Ankyrin repeat domain-containing protein 50 n=1 Tax=Cladobotryum mycophilum TaxID=491253 RepID=A0ABR0SMR2_9HYPO
MLDERHLDLPKPPNDHNTYTLGSIGKHNIVIACLPKGQYGTNSAATVATWMVGTFPSIKFGLMVGIGAGIPPNVRLGDVVVSTPSNGYPGVVQWDSGKVEEGNNVKRTGSLNNPPSALLTALTKLETTHEMEGSKVPQYLDELKEKWPRLVPKYIRSDSLVDTLLGQSKPREMRVHYGLVASGNKVIKDAKFRDDINQNLGGKVLCIEMEAAGLMNDFPCIVIRGICDYADSHENNDWQEHAAAVAAAFAKELLYVVLAQEVEEMQTIKILLDVHDQIKAQSIILKNIDSRQRSQEDQAILDWLTPINFAPQHDDFFGRRRPNTGQWILNSPEYQNWLEARGQILFCQGIPGAGKTIITSIVIDDVRRKFSEDKTVGVAYIYCNFNRKEEQKADNLLAAVLKQLCQSQVCVPDDVKNLHMAQQEIGRARPSLENISETLRLVVESYSRVFIIVDALDECQTSDGCRSELLAKIFNLQADYDVNLFATSRFIAEIETQFEKQFEKCAHLEIRASDDDLRIYLHHCISNLPSFVKENEELQMTVKDAIVGAVDGMFLLAQLYAGFLEDKTSPRALKIALGQFEKQNALSNEDQKLKLLERAYIQTMKRVGDQKKGFQELAQNVLQLITCARRPLKTSEIQHALAVKVDEHKFDEENIIQIGLMVSVCAGLVTVDEESDIIRFVHYTTQEFFDQTKDRWFPKADADIARISIGYLSFDAFEGGRCQTDDGSEYSCDSNTDMFEERRDDLEQRLDDYCFYDYAARNWGYHCLEACKSDAIESSELTSRVVQFLKSKNKMEASVQAMMSVKSLRGYYSQQVQNGLTGLHIAAYFGLSTAAEALILSGHNIEVLDSDRRTAQPWAAGNGQETIIRLLIQKEAEIDSVDNDNQTPLIWAVKKGHEAVVKLLIENKADVNFVGHNNQTPLLEAIHGRHKAVARLLINNKANVNFADKEGWSPLLWAVKKGHEAVVRLFIENGARIYHADNDGRTSLLWAVNYGYERIVEILIRKRACIHTKDVFGTTALHLAARRGHLRIILLLLENGADVNLKDSLGGTPLAWAMEHRSNEAAKMLLETKINLKVNFNSGPMLWTMEPRFNEADNTLLETQVRVNYMYQCFDARQSSRLSTHLSRQDSKFYFDLRSAGDWLNSKPPGFSGEISLLARAIEKGDEEIIRILLEKGAEWNYGSDLGLSALSAVAEKKNLLESPLLHNWRDRYGRSLLFIAAEGGNQTIVGLLLEKGSDPNSKDDGGQTPLHHASKEGHEKIVELLLLQPSIDADPRIEHFYNEGRTPLSFAAERGHGAVVELLLATGKVDLDSRDIVGTTPLLWAAQNRNEAMVWLLLTTQRVDVNYQTRLKGRERRTPLSWVSEFGFEALVKKLLEATKFDPDLPDGDVLWEQSHVCKRGRTPLSYAAAAGHEGIVDLLLYTGANPNFKDRDRKTPLSYAIKNKHQNIAKRLRCWARI